MNTKSDSLTFLFPKNKRLRTSAQFKICYDSVRAGDSHLLVFAAANSSQQSRLGVSVSKKHGNAVVRAHKKRLLREAFRLSQHQLPIGFDFVLVPRQRPDSRLADFQHSLTRLAKKVVRKIGTDS